MRQGKGLLERIYDWAQDYGWSIPTFGFGMLAAIILTAGRGWVDAFSALGSLGAALAAFWSVLFAIHVQRERDGQEDEAREPNLVITEIAPVRLLPGAPHVQETQIFCFTNLSREAMYVNYLYRIDGVSDSSKKLEFVAQVESVVPSYQSIRCSLDLTPLQQIGHYELLFYFTYAMTGSLFYRLRLPVDTRQYNIRMIEFEVGKQFVEGPIAPPPGFVKFAMVMPVREPPSPELDE